ncbi:hypothetical protein [Streptomyces sp. NPDC052012]|uniref:hypothetical protein n=1 Tax=Streptomyces sp. NPDC052012 TaxID=3155051 RepID=UPI00344D85EC
MPLQAADLAAAVRGSDGAGLQGDLTPRQVWQLIAQLLLIPLDHQEVVAAGGHDVSGVGALRVHRICGDDDTAQVDPVQQRGRGRDFIALRGDLTPGDHGLAGVQRGGEQVDGCAVGAGSAHGLAVDGQADQRVAGFVDRVRGVPGEPGAHGVVERVAV